MRRAIKWQVLSSRNWQPAPDRPIEIIIIAGIIQNLVVYTGKTYHIITNFAEL